MSSLWHVSCSWYPIHSCVCWTFRDLLYHWKRLPVLLQRACARLVSVWPFLLFLFFQTICQALLTFFFTIPSAVWHRYCFLQRRPKKPYPNVFSIWVFDSSWLFDVSEWKNWPSRFPLFFDLVDKDFPESSKSFVLDSSPLNQDQSLAIFLSLPASDDFTISSRSDNRRRDPEISPFLAASIPAPGSRFATALPQSLRIYGGFIPSKTNEEQERLGV